MRLKVSFFCVTCNSHPGFAYNNMCVASLVIAMIWHNG